MEAKKQSTPSEKRTDRARTLRHDATFPERLLWGILRDRQLDGFKFRRQFPIDVYVVDFACAEARLVVEIDGMTHVGTGERDDQRTHELERLGYRVIRVTNDEVLENMEAVAEMILGAVSENVAPSRLKVPSSRPSPRGRGGKR